MRPRLRSALSLTTAAALSVTGLALAVPAQAASPDVVISEVYGGGGNSGATLTNDFIELYNPSSAPVDVSTWSVQYASSSGTSWAVTNLTGTVPAGGHYLVQEAAGTGGTTPLPTPDATGSIAMSGSSGKVALVTDQTALTCGADCDTAPDVRDFVGYGSANDSETSPAPGLSNTTSDSRTGAGTDTDNNAADFTAGAPTPENATGDGPPPPAPEVSISEVYGGGGNSGAPYTNDFVELFNGADTAVDVTGWSVQYASSTGTSYAPTTLTGSIQPGGYYLIALAGGTTGQPLPTPDATGTTNLSATNGKVALVSDSVALSCGTDCDGAPTVLDFVGYGSADDFEAAPAPAASNTTSVQRTIFDGTVDTDNNAVDFVATDPTPGVALDDPGAVEGLRIHDIQAAAQTSPYDGQVALDVPGVVTAVSTNRFWMQDPQADADVATSEGIVVFTGSAPSVTVGQSVTVTGTVDEFGFSGELTTTELTSPTVTPLAESLGTVTSTVIGVDRIPPNTVIDDDGLTSFDPVTDGIDFYESLEGMLVEVADAEVVGPTSSFGEVTVVSGATDAGLRTPRGGIIVQPGDFNPERVILDDSLIGAGQMPAANVGDAFTAGTLGVLDYNFGNFKLEVLAPPTRQDNGLQREVTGLSPGAAQLTVGTFNVENLDPTDPQSKFDELASILVTNMGAPDLVALEEIQDNNGASMEGDTDASLTFTQFIAAIQAAGGPTYSYQQINPVAGQDGGEPGGNIRVGFLYRTDRGLAFVQRGEGDATTATQVLDVGGTPQLSLSPGRIDPTNPAWDSSRKPLAGEFTFQGQTFFAIANHFNSKGGDDPLYGSTQPPVRSSEVQRHQQAQIVNDFVDDILAVDPQAKVVVLGDLNDFQFSDTVKILEGTQDNTVAAAAAPTPSGGVLTNLIGTLPTNEQYSYDFEGNSQTLDNILLSNSLLTRLAGYDVVHVNSEFADQASDHDPQVALLDFGSAGGGGGGKLSQIIRRLLCTLFGYCRG